MRSLALFALILTAFTSVVTAQISTQPASQQVLHAAGNSSFGVTVPAGVEWTVTVAPGITTPNVDWIAVTSDTTQTGSGTVAFTYTEHATLLPRTAVFTLVRTDGLGSTEFLFVQEPPDSTALVDPTSITIDGFGGNRNISVSVGPQIQWQATSNRTWIQIVTGPTTGPGTLVVTIQPNFTGVARNGTISVLNATVSVSQGFEDVTFTLGSSSAQFPYQGGSGSVTVTVNAPAAPWQATSNDSFIIITNGGAYTGSGTVTYTVATNPDESTRQGTITIAGETFTVDQAANPGAPPANLTSSPNSLQYTYIPDRTSILTRDVTVNSTGDEENFSVQIVNASWLNASSNNGTTPSTLTFSANPAQLPVGNYTGSIVLTPAGGGNPLTIPVTLAVQSAVDALPLLNASPRSLYFNRNSGASPPPPQRIRLGNPGTVVNADLSIEPNIWMNAQLVNDASGPGVLVSIRSVNMQPGIYESLITIKSGSQSFAELTVPVRHVVKLAGGGGPVISSGGIVNGATYASGGAPGTWISVFGTGLANSTQVWNPSTAHGSLLPTNLDGTEVFIGGVRAPISYVSPSQVNALVPSILDRGWVPLEVRVNNQPTEGGYIYLRDADPAFFVYSPQGGIYPAAQHPDAVAVGPVGLFPGGPPSRPAAGVGTIVLYGTGFGQTNPAVNPLTYFQGAASLEKPEDVRVRVGGLNAQIQFVGLVAPGLYQINVVLPGLIEGDYFLNAVINGLTTQPGLKLVLRQ